MIRSLVAIVFTLAVHCALSHGKIWDRCELARTMVYKYGFKPEDMADLMCIAYRESRYDSTHINTYNSDGSKDYGIFQVNNRYWCKNNQSPPPNQNLCGVSCDQMLYNMDALMKCVKFMSAHSVALKLHRYFPWTTWPYCEKENNRQQYIQGCNLPRAG